MSLATRQSVALLSIVYSVFTTIKQYNLAPELEATILYGIDTTEKCIINFPGTGDNRKSEKWIREKIHCIDDDLRQSESVYTMIVLVSLSNQILADMMQKIRNRTKLEMLEEVNEITISISNKIDPKGDQFEAYEEADKLLLKLYHHLGFIQ